MIYLDGELADLQGGERLADDEQDLGVGDHRVERAGDVEVLIKW